MNAYLSLFYSITRLENLLPLTIENIQGTGLDKEENK